MPTIQEAKAGAFGTLRHDLVTLRHPSGARALGRGRRRGRGILSGGHPRQGDGQQNWNKEPFHRIRLRFYFGRRR